MGAVLGAGSPRGTGASRRDSPPRPARESRERPPRSRRRSSSLGVCGGVSGSSGGDIGDG